MEYKKTLKERAIDIKCKSLNFIARHKTEIIVLMPVIVSLVSYGGKAVIKRANINKLIDSKELYCYDRSLGHYWELKRKLTNGEWAQIDYRKRAGEPISMILTSLNVLK